MNNYVINSKSWDGAVTPDIKIIETLGAGSSGQVYKVGLQDQAQHVRALKRPKEARDDAAVFEEHANINFIHNRLENEGIDGAVLGNRGQVLGTVAPFAFSDMRALALYILFLDPGFLADSEEGDDEDAGGVTDPH